MDVIGISRNQENLGFDVFGKVEGSWPTAETIRNICPISLDALILGKTLKNDRPDHL